MTAEDEEFDYVENDSVEERTTVPKKMVKGERLNSVFGLPPQEKVIKTYPCFLVAEILIQGTMLVTEHHVCFSSNIPGLKRNIKIKFSRVTAITKEKVYAIFPTAIGIHTQQEKTTFSYVTPRDKLLQLLNSRWSEALELEEECASSARDSVPEDSAVTQPSNFLAVTGSSEASALNDGDSGIAVSPSSDSADESDVAEAADEGSGEGEDGLPEADATRPQQLARRLSLALDSRGLTRQRGFAIVGLLLVLSALAVIVLSVRLHQLQQQMLLLLAEQRIGGLSEQQQVQLRLGDVLQSLGGLQQRLAVLRDSLTALAPDG